MALGFRDVRKAITRGIKEGASIAYKPVDDRLDVVRDIIDRPFTAPLRLGRAGLEQAPVYRAGMTLTRIPGVRERVLEPAFRGGMNALSRLDDLATGAAVMYGSDVRVDPETGRLNPNWISPLDLFTENPQARFERNLSLLEQETGKDLRARNRLGFPGGRILDIPRAEFMVAQEAGRLYEEDPDIPAGVKFAGSVLGDPTVYGSAGLKPALNLGLKAAGVDAAKLARQYPKLAKAGRAANWALEGFDSPRTLAGFTAGGALGAQIAERTETPWDDAILPLLTGQLGIMKFSDFTNLANVARVAAERGRFKKSLKDYWIVPNGADTLVKRIVINPNSITPVRNEKTKLWEIELEDGYKFEIESRPDSQPTDVVLKFKEWLENYWEGFGHDHYVPLMKETRVFFHTGDSRAGWQDIDAEAAELRTARSRGPGIYITSDPVQSAKYGDRTFVLEIQPDSEIMQMGMGPNQRDIYVWNNVVRKLRQTWDIDISDYFDYEIFRQPNILNSQIYAHIEDLVGWKAEREIDTRDLKTKFNEDIPTAKSFINDALSRSGVDGFVFRSTSDKDTVVMLNTEKLNEIMEIRDNVLGDLGPIDEPKSFSEFVKDAPKTSRLTHEQVEREKDLIFNDRLAFRGTQNAGDGWRDLSFMPINRVWEIMNTIDTGEATYFNTTTPNFWIEISSGGGDIQHVDAGTNLWKVTIRNRPAEDPLIAFYLTRDPNIDRAFIQKEDPLFGNNIHDLSPTTDITLLDEYIDSAARAIQRKPSQRWRSFGRRPGAPDTERKTRKDITGSVFGFAVADEGRGFEFPSDEEILSRYPPLDDETVLYRAYGPTARGDMLHLDSLLASGKTDLTKARAIDPLLLEFYNISGAFYKRIADERGLDPSKLTNEIINRNIEIEPTEIKNLKPIYSTDLTTKELEQRVEFLKERLSRFTDSFYRLSPSYQTAEEVLEYKEHIKATEDLLDWHEYLRGKKLRESEGGQSSKMRIADFEEEENFGIDLSDRDPIPEDMKEDIILERAYGLDFIISWTLDDLKKLRAADPKWIKDVIKTETFLELHNVRKSFFQRMADDLGYEPTKRPEGDGLSELTTEAIRPRHISELSVEELDLKIKELEEYFSRDDIDNVNIKWKEERQAELEVRKAAKDLLEYTRFIRNKRINQGLEFVPSGARTDQFRRSPFLSFKRDPVLAGIGAAAGYAATGEEEGALEGAGVGFMAGGLARGAGRYGALPAAAIDDNPIDSSKERVILNDPYVPESIVTKVSDNPADIIWHPVYNPGGKKPELQVMHELPSIRTELENVSTVKPDNLFKEIVRLFGKFIAPDILETSPVGKLLIAHRRLVLKSRNLVDVAISAQIDTYAGKWGLRDIVGRNGTIFRTDENGIVEGIGKHWSTIIGDVAKYKYRLAETETPGVYQYFRQLNDTQLRFANDFIKILEDLGALRYLHGLDPEMGSSGRVDEFLDIFKAKDGSIWIPRVLTSVDDIEIPKRSDAGKERLYEEIEDHIANGGKFDDPRDTLRLFAKETYEDILAKQLADELVNHSIHIDKLIDAKLVQAYKNAEEYLEEAKKAVEVALKEYQSYREIPARQRNKDRLNELLERLEDARIERDAAQEDFEASRERVRQAKEAIRNTGKTLPGHVFGYNKDRVLVKEWSNKFLGSGRYFEYEDYKKLVDALGIRGITVREGDPNWTAKIWRVVGNSARFLAASLDFAAPLTHGIPLLGRRPDLWAKATSYHYAAFLRPGAREEYIKANFNSIQRMVGFGVDPADPETFAAIQHGGEVPFLIHKLLKLTGDVGGTQDTKQAFVNQAFKQTFGRFSNSLNTFLIIARHEMWKAYENNWKDPYALASWINKMTGGVNSQMLGVSKTQRDWESTWLAFSPRLFRSTLALAGDAINVSNWNRKHIEARRSLLQLGFGAFALYTAIGIALNAEDFAKDPESAFKKHVAPGLNPLNGKRFLSHKIGDTWYGVGGQVRALVQLVAGASANPTELGKMSDDNPLIAYYRSRGAPAIDMSTSLIEGFTGADANPYEEINGPLGTIKSASMNFLPLTLQGALEGDSVGGIIAGSQGMRTSPETTREFLDKKARELYGKPLKELNREEKTEFYEKYPPRLRNDNVSRYYQQVDAINQEFIANVNRYAQRVKARVPGFTKEGYRVYHQSQEREKANKLKGIRSSFSVVDANVPGFDGSVIDYLESRELQEEDKAVQEYYRISEFFLDPETGRFDHEGYITAQQDYLSKLPTHIRDYVVRNTKKEDENLLTTEMRIAQEDAKVYFEINNETWTDFGRALPNSIFAMFESYDEFSEWLDVTAQQSGVTRETLINYLEKNYPPYKRFNEMATERKRLFRLADPEAGENLTEFYGIEPANRIDYILRQRGIRGFGESSAEAYAVNPDLNDMEQAQRLAFGLNPVNFNRRFTTQQSRFAQRRLAFRQLQNN